MTSELRDKAIEMAASYFANWKACEAALETDEARDYRNRYEGAKRMAALLGIEGSEIEEAAWRMHGETIQELYEANNATR